MVTAGNLIMQWLDSANTRPCYSSPHTAVTSSSNAKPRSTARIDNSLTSLNWLPEFKIPSIEGKPDEADHSQCGGCDESVQSKHSSITNSDSASSTGSVTQESEVERDECFLPLSPIKRCLNQTAEFERNPLRFEDDPDKPPFSYTTIIYLAIRSCRKEKVMLSDIYQWIKDHFMYYRIAESTWQNSVRHNLSLNQFFNKIPRGEGDPGKGSFWQINPEYDHLLSNDQELQRLLKQQNNIKAPTQRKRSKNRKKANRTDNNSNGCNVKQNKRNAKQITTTSPPDPYHLPCDLDWVSLLSSQKLSGCISCNETHCRPSFGSPIPSDSIVDHIVSPAITLYNRILDTPPQKSLEEIITTQESPAPLLPPWAAETRPYSPNNFEHPWAEVEGSTHVKHWSSPPQIMWNSTNTPQLDQQAKLQIPQLI